MDSRWPAPPPRPPPGRPPGGGSRAGPALRPARPAPWRPPCPPAAPSPARGGPGRPGRAPRGGGRRRRPRTGTPSRPRRPGSRSPPGRPAAGRRRGRRRRRVRRPRRRRPRRRASAPCPGVEGRPAHGQRDGQIRLPHEGRLLLHVQVEGDRGEARAVQRVVLPHGAHETQGGLAAVEDADARGGIQGDGLHGGTSSAVRPGGRLHAPCSAILHRKGGPTEARFCGFSTPLPHGGRTEPLGNGSAGEAVGRRGGAGAAAWIFS